MENAATASPQRKPRLALALATGLGLGYIPKIPGTAGSLPGVLIVWGEGFLLHQWAGPGGEISAAAVNGFWLLAVVVVAAAGVWSAGVAARYLEKKDPPAVVVDETSGQMLAFAPVMAVLNWKYLLLGFILFRVFDICKPWPVRQAERLPGGWGIMADDWAAGLYAAAGLWAARAAGL